ncbi:MAG: sigma 54-interacting transcriptional regulator [Myxococcota bacterium]
MSYQHESKEVTQVARMQYSPRELRISRIRLVVEDGPQKGQEWMLEKDLVRMGNREDNDVVIPGDRTVSRYHAELCRINGDILLRDLGSTNGTWLDGHRVREVYLKPNTVFTVGSTPIRFEPTSEKLEIFPSRHEQFGELVGRSLKMREVFGVLEKIAPTDVTVLIEADTGTGKELVARGIHTYSRRAKKSLVIFDCGAVPENLIESELFGHEKGAFTGAVAARPGVFEAADGGTLFLDEIGELPLDLQPKLLRALESREVRRVGSTSTKKIDVRVVAATNRDLREEVKAGRFREDLFYRLAVVQLGLPSLKERADDIPLLVRHFLKRIHSNVQPDGSVRVSSMSEEVKERLMSYDWPGNVRELYNCIERACSFAEGSEIILADLPDQLKGSRSTLIQHLPLGGGLPFKDAKEKVVELFEREYLVDLLKRNGLNISRAAREAQIDRKSISRLLKKHGIKIHGLKDEEE